MGWSTMLVGERVRPGGINCARKMLHSLVCDDEEAIRCDSCCEVCIVVIKVDIDVDVVECQWIRVQEGGKPAFICFSEAGV